MEAQLNSCRSMVENPCSACMPLGAILPFKGIRNAMVIIHGSQGCSTYMRRHLSEHYNEPIDVASSSINEKGTIYGGADNLKKGLDNLIKVYQPDLIGVLTTCLAETIGEDIEHNAAEYLAERGWANYPLVTVPTPGYGGSHSEGYFLAVKRVLEQLSDSTYKHNRLNLIVPNLSPADVREIKRIMDLMGLSYILFPDYSETLDSPFSHPYRKIAEGGTGLSDLKSMAGSAATIQMGVCVEDSISPGKFLESAFGVPLYTIPIPMGIEATDGFIKLLQELSGKKIPPVLERERGRLLDCMIDSHKYNAEGRAVIFGEPDLALAATRTCLENGISPQVVATGAHSRMLHMLVEQVVRGATETVAVLDESDFSGIRQIAKERSTNIAIGHSDGRYLTEREGIPLVRLGFPIHDRVGGQRLLSVGYTGTIMFLDRITNTLLEHKLNGYRQTMLNEYYSGASNGGAL
ncbi:MAG TPA: nitrogenase component 1 [Syntrophomonadaceae bacterium]|nr:nitrogenase component 1 [Syntrophomonadaceae bacterium]